MAPSARPGSDDRASAICASPFAGTPATSRARTDRHSHADFLRARVTAMHDPVDPTADNTPSTLAREQRGYNTEDDRSFANTTRGRDVDDRLIATIALLLCGPPHELSGGSSLRSAARVRRRGMNGMCYRIANASSVALLECRTLRRWCARDVAGSGSSYGHEGQAPADRSSPGKKALPHLVMTTFAVPGARRPSRSPAAPDPDAECVEVSRRDCTVEATGAGRPRRAAAGDITRHSSVERARRCDRRLCTPEIASTFGSSLSKKRAASSAV